jgi:hypothetical protein
MLVNLGIDTQSPHLIFHFFDDITWRGGVGHSLLERFDEVIQICQIVHLLANVGLGRKLMGLLL